MARVFARRARRAEPRAGAGRARPLPRARRRPRRAGRTGRPTRARVLVFSAAFGVLLYLILRTQSLHPWNPQDLSSGTWDVSFNTASSFLTNTNWQFYARRDDAVVLLADGRPGGAELRLRRRRHRRRSSPSSAASRSRSGTELGIFYVDLTRTLLYVLLPISVLVGAVPGLPGRAADARRLRDATGLTGADADARAAARSPRRRRSRARHQRRRLLQRQLGDAVREPDVAHELRRDALDPHHPGGADRDVRAHGRQPPPGLGDLRRDDGALRRRASSSSTSPRRGATPARCTPPALTGGNLEGKEQRFGIGSTVAVRRRHDRRVLRRGQRRDGVADRPRRRGPDGAA